MIELRFIPIFKDQAFTIACTEYERIWAEDGERIVATLEKYTGFTLNEERIAALVYEGPSFSGRNEHDAMKLRASYYHDTKKGTLVHELAHRLTFHIDHEDSEACHRFLFLFLYDVWEELYGTAFADANVAIESARSDMYQRAWEFALELSPSERRARLGDWL